MVYVEHARVKGGQIVLDEPLPIAEDTEVTVRVEPVIQQADKDDTPFEQLPFFGMWADREDMADSVTSVRGEREKWHQRSLRTG